MEVASHWIKTDEAVAKAESGDSHRITICEDMKLIFLRREEEKKQMYVSVSIRGYLEFGVSLIFLVFGALFTASGLFPMEGDSDCRLYLS